MRLSILNTGVCKSGVGQFDKANNIWLSWEFSKQNCIMVKYSLEIVNQGLMGEHEPLN